MHIHGPKDAGAARDRGRLPGSRALRQPRRRPEHVPRPRGATAFQRPQRGRDGAAAPPRRSKSLAVTTIRSIRQPVATLSGGQRQSVAVARAVHVELEARHPRRADRGARRRADRAGARARAPARRAGPRRRAHLAQPPRHLRDRRPHHRAAARPQRRRLRARDDDAAGGRRRRSPPARRRRSPASPSTEGGAGGDTGGRRRPRPPEAARGGQLPAGWPASGRAPGSTSAPATSAPFPIIVGRGRRHPPVRVHGDELLHRRQLRQPDHADAPARRCSRSASSSCSCSARSTSRSATWPASAR